MRLEKGIEKPSVTPTARVKRMARQRGEALSIKMDTGITFAEVVKRMKANAGNITHGITRMRRAQNGHPLIEFAPEGNAKKLLTSINGKMGEGIEIKRLRPTCDVEIRDIDPTMEDDEVLGAMNDLLKTDGAEVNIRSLRLTDMGMKLAIIEIPLQLAKNMEDSPRIKIGWTSCRVRILPKLIRCFNCHGFGQMAGRCPMGVNRGKCRRCGAEGHKHRECTATPRCTMCEHKGKKGNLIVHIAGSTRCPEYREAIAKVSQTAKK